MMMVHSTHDTRISDASTFDEICNNCGATDTPGSNLLYEPCPGKREMRMTNDYKQKKNEAFAKHYGQLPTAPETTTRVFCTLQFAGFHKWEMAPEPVAYLRDLHRHVFHVRAEKVVSHDDRDIEFITLKLVVQATIASLIQQPERIRNWSCEMWAKHLLGLHDLDRCEVSEDGENGAVVERVA